MSEVAAPFIVTLRIPNRGRLMVDDRRAMYIKVCSLRKTALTQTSITFHVPQCRQLPPPPPSLFCCVYLIGYFS